MAGMIGSFRGESGLVVVTNDPAIASELARFGKKHILLGGQIHQVTQTISGSISQMQIMSYRFDMCFISADAISEDGKVTGAIADESTLKKQAILQSQQKILVATARKWGKCSGTMIADLQEFDTWITEKCPQTAAQLCEKLSVKVINSYKK
jgi:DeoR family glycerol-3-phosphate regulon repressor